MTKLYDVISKSYNYNNSELNRSLFESTLVHELTLTLKDWIKHSKRLGVIIGGLALSYHARPRVTTDIDIIFLSDSDIPDFIEGFKKHRKHSFIHKKTHVKIETLTPEHIDAPVPLVKTIYLTAVESQGIKIANKGGLIALKSIRGSRQDAADIEVLFKTGDVDLKPFVKFLSDKQLKFIEDIQKDLR